MSSKENHRLGITPIVIRTAAYYLMLGEGIYYPNHPHYDEVTVRKTYDLKQNALDENEWGFGMVVSFYKNTHCLRWVEFGCRTVGAGGDDILKRV